MAQVLGPLDNELGWLPASLLAGRRICKRHRPDVIIATAPTLSAFLTGSILSRVYGVPLVLDYRDPLTAYDWPSGSKVGRNRTRLRSRLEQWAIRDADAAVFCSDLIRAPFEIKLNHIRPRTLAVITNGFNEPEGLEPGILEPDTFNIIYAGVMYGERRLSTLVEAMANVAARKADSGIKLAVHFFGSIRQDDRDRIEALGLGHLVREWAPVEHKKILGFMRVADALYLPSGNDHSYAYPFKTFDYLSVKRPILAVSPAGSAVARLLGEIDCGELASEDEPGAIADALERLIDRAGQYRYAGRERFTWGALADRYETVLNEVIELRQSSPGR